MNKFCLTAGLCLLSYHFSTAQVINYKNSIRVGTDYMSLDAPDDLGFRYVARYARHLANDRFVLEGSLGYLSIENRRLVFNNFYFTGRPRQRVTADLTVSFDFLRTARHALRLGGGPSVWYRKDDRLREARSVVNQSGQVTGVTILSEKADEANLGYHVAAEYDYAISPRITLAGRVGMANLSKAGISSAAGVNVGYRF
ncbi:DUF481 domain-containing protein [Spirosoma sp. 209]|uniref:DUF481 domain-containing protein n=1 Tax=Spirosoma sp. 209 TaxID=1955701 RepID=UPI0011178B7D|nr:DUF481 domain-containing protein [Spirosoma sp. 209]